ncbi:hypothetical protein [Euzebya rosea]|uniref:hypothetical protein n=1 Tax=Euzebya rosea TaxID=2052804 RepID=UPI000D3E4D62|nr:hypothetical protein [Euzebya rosea]
MHLDAHGFRVALPDKWEGAVQRGRIDERVAARAREAGRPVHTPPVLHLTSASLPEVRGDFGSGAVDLLGDDDVFIALIEYGPENLGTALFDTGRMPRRLSVADFAPNGLQRAIAGQSGTQVFCTEAGRALCLYVVLGGHWQARRLLPRVNDALSRIDVAPAEVTPS